MLSDQICLSLPCQLPRNAGYPKCPTLTGPRCASFPQLFWASPSNCRLKIRDGPLNRAAPVSVRAAVFGSRSVDRDFQGLGSRAKSPSLSHRQHR